MTEIERVPGSAAPPFATDSPLDVLSISRIVQSDFLECTSGFLYNRGCSFTIGRRALLRYHIQKDLPTFTPNIEASRWSPRFPIEDVPEQWRHTFAVHVDAAYYLCRSALPWMKANKEGVILLISSAAGIRGCPGAITYGTVKGAILQFTRALARDLADDNIRVNCLAPGIIRTRFHDAMTDDQQKHNLANRIPLHREGTVGDVAEAARLLVTNEFITGEAIVIDGGMTMQIVR